MQDYSLIALLTLLFTGPFIPSIWIALQADLKKAMKAFLLAEFLVGISLLLICVYLGEVAPHQGAISFNVFSGKDPFVQIVWDSVQWLFRLSGLIFSSIFAGRYFRPGKNGKLPVELLNSIFCLAYGLTAPFLMSQLVATIRDAFLL